MIQIIAGLASDNGLDCKDGELLNKKKHAEYFKWVNENIEGTTLLLDNSTNVNNNFPESKTYEFGKDILTVGEVLNLSKRSTISILGGEELIKLFIDKADVLKLAEIDGTYWSTKFFPNFDVEKYDVTSVEDIEGDLVGVFKEYRRIKMKG